jgi:hypothetical protein
MKVGRLPWLIVVLAASLPAFAQDEPPGPRESEPPAAPPAPPAPPKDDAAPKPDEPPADRDALAARLADLYATVARPPSASGVSKAAEPDKARAEAARAQSAWREAVGRLDEAGDRYVAAFGADADARALFHAGFGKMHRADLQPATVSPDTRAAAADLLSRSLAAAKPEADFRADAELALGRLQALLVGPGRAAPEDVAATCLGAVKHLRAAGRLDDSGRAAVTALQCLLTRGKEAEARSFAAAIDAAKADFGGPTDTVRLAAARAETGVGMPFPPLADAEDADGRPVRWAAFRGKPLLVHFFRAGNAAGRLSEERDVAKVVRPLHEELGPKGLRVVGVSMDLALSKERVERIRADWDEWGLKEKVQDGSRASVRAWCEDEGVAWPWLWDGAWLRNPVSRALGGAGRSNSHAVLVDAEGVIRWRGDGPFDGLAEAARKLCE